MLSKPLQVVNLTSEDPLTRGHQHGESFRQQVAELAEIRLERMCNAAHYPKIRDVMELAEKHLPVLDRYDGDLFLELQGISEGANVSLPMLMVLNNYTDMRDIVPNKKAQSDDAGGCTVIFSPNDHRPILGQTWDIHASALPYVIMLRLNDALVFSVTGCLGMTGMNQHGLAIAINNLCSKEATVGVMWPAVVRRALKNTNVADAHRDIARATIGSGRHYALADGEHFLGLEVSAQHMAVITDDAHNIYFHTNHCLDKQMEKGHFILEGSTTLWRYNYLEDHCQNAPTTPEEMFLTLKEVSSPAGTSPHATATCGTVVMDINARTLLACLGIASKELLSCPETTIKL